MKFLAGMFLGGGLILAGANLPLGLIAEDGNAPALIVKGEAVFQRDAGPGGHPGTPLSIIRSRMPADGFGAGLRIANWTGEMPVAGFGGSVNFQGTGADGDRDQAGVGWIHETTPTRENESPAFFAYTLQKIDGSPRPFVAFSIGREGVTFYAPECGWWDGNCWTLVNGEWVAESGHYPRPVARVGPAGVVNSSGECIQ